LARSISDLWGFCGVVAGGVAGTAAAADFAVWSAATVATGECVAVPVATVAEPLDSIALDAELSAVPGAGTVDGCAAFVAASVCAS
jgi:hypothetical protein